MSTSRTEIAIEAAKATPPAVVVASNKLLGLDMPTVVALATLLYLLIQIAYLVWKWRHEAHDRRRRNEPVPHDRRHKQHGAAKPTVVAAMLAAGTLALASPMLMNFLERWEGRENVAYADKLAGGLPTVCAGLTKHTSPVLIAVGDYWSDAECERIERLVVGGTQMKLADCLHVRISQQTFDALSSHAHNFGVPSTCASRAVGLINAGRLLEGCNALAHAPDGKTPVWSYVTRKDGSKQYVRGLYNRRLAERDMCLSGTI